MQQREEDTDKSPRHSLSLRLPSSCSFSSTPFSLYVSLTFSLLLNMTLLLPLSSFPLVVFESCLLSPTRRLCQSRPLPFLVLSSFPFAPPFPIRFLSLLHIGFEHLFSSVPYSYRTQYALTCSFISAFTDFCLPALVSFWRTSFPREPLLLLSQRHVFPTLACHRHISLPPDNLKKKGGDTRKHRRNDDEKPVPNARKTNN